MDLIWGSTCSTFWLFPLLCLVVLAGMMFMMFRRGGCMPMVRRSRTSPDRAQETPRQLLDRRLAGGQITREQYDSIRRDIETP
jgi:uncharacterized membrane protein